MHLLPSPGRGLHAVGPQPRIWTQNRVQIHRFEMGGDIGQARARVIYQIQARAALIKSVGMLQGHHNRDFRSCRDAASRLGHARLRVGARARPFTRFEARKSVRTGSKANSRNRRAGCWPDELIPANDGAIFYKDSRTRRQCCKSNERRH